MKTERRSPANEVPPPPEFLWLLVIASAISLIHILTNGRYGFHRDELQFLSDSRHLDWGFVAYPPLIPFLCRINFAVFGLSLEGLRLFAVLAQAAVIVITGLMAFELGGRRLAQVTAALTVALSPIPIFLGTQFQYSSLDFLWWVLIAYFTIRLLKTGNPRWWLAIGAAIGLGLLTKYIVVVLIAGLLGGLAFTSGRRFFLKGWFWGGVGLALLMFLPNFLWLVRHNFVSYRFLQFIHGRDVQLGRAEGFLPEQFLNCVNIVAVPVAVAGLVSYLMQARYRMLAWMYLIPLVLFYFSQGRGYYLAPAYPMLLAMGACTAERWIASLATRSTAAAKTRPRGQATKVRRRPALGPRVVQAVFFTGLTVWAAYTCTVVLPLQSHGALRNFALVRNDDLREEFGWNEMVKTVAAIRDSLPLEQRAGVGVFTGNYGEQGAIEMMGPAYHLPPPISPTNSGWLRGYPTPQPTTLIVLGYSRQSAEQDFTGCRLAGHNTNSEGVKNEESQGHPDIFVCGPPRLAWPQFWETYYTFG